MEIRLIGTCALLAGLAGLPIGGGALLAQDIPPPEVIYLFADLSGADETVVGDPDGYGDFAAAVKLAEGKLCYELSVGKIAAPTAAHVSEGKAGDGGAPVMAIVVTGPANETCLKADAKLLKNIAEKPGNYYVDVNTADFPDGAIRGQLQM